MQLHAIPVTDDDVWQCNHCSGTTQTRMLVFRNQLTGAGVCNDCVQKFFDHIVHFRLLHEVDHDQLTRQ